MLSVSDGVLDPVFSPTTTDYTVTVTNNISGVSLTPTTNHPGATVKVSGVSVGSGQPSAKIAIPEGKNITINVVVTAQDGTTTKQYNIVIARQPSHVCLLSQLSVTSGSLQFASTNYTYDVTIPNSVSSINITADTQHDSASITRDGVPMMARYPITESLQEGVESHIVIKVLAQDRMTTCKYYLLVHRQCNDDATLKNITASAGTITPPFSSNILEYNLDVANAVSHTSFTSVATHVESIIFTGTIKS